MSKALTAKLQNNACIPTEGANGKKKKLRPNGIQHVWCPEARRNWFLILHFLSGSIPNITSNLTYWGKDHFGFYDFLFGGWESRWKDHNQTKWHYFIILNDDILLVLLIVFLDTLIFLFWWQKGKGDLTAPKMSPREGGSWAFHMISFQQINAENTYVERKHWRRKYKGRRSSCIQKLIIQWRKRDMWTTD